MNMDVMRAFGAYAQTTFRSGEVNHTDLQARLYALFPEFVAAPEQEGSEAA